MDKLDPIELGLGFLTGWHRYDSPPRDDLHSFDAAKIAGLFDEGCRRWPRANASAAYVYVLETLPTGSYADPATIPACSSFAPYVDRNQGRAAAAAVPSIWWMEGYEAGFNAVMDRRKNGGDTRRGWSKLSLDDVVREDAFVYCRDHPAARLDAAVDDSLRRFERFAMSEGWGTALDQGPAPAGYKTPAPAALTSALAALESVTGPDLSSRLAAYNLVADALSFGDLPGPTRAGIVRAFSRTPTARRIYTAMLTLNTTWPELRAPDSTRLQGRLDRVSALNADDQAIIYDQVSRRPGASDRRFGSLDSYKANLRAHIAIETVVERLQADNRVASFQQLAVRFVSSRAFKQLQAVRTRDDNDTDAWTAAATQAVALCTELR